MTDAPDLLAAELDAIEQRQEQGSLREFATADSPRLLSLASDVLDAIYRWKRQRQPLTPQRCTRANCSGSSRELLAVTA